MFERLIKKLETRGSLEEINTEEWIEISALEAPTEDRSDNFSNRKKVTLYPPKSVVDDFLVNLSQAPRKEDYLKTNLPLLLLVSNFCEQRFHFLSTNYYGSLNLNLNQWVRFVKNFELNNRKKLAASYFFEQIAIILKSEYNQVIMMVTQRDFKHASTRNSFYRKEHKTPIKRRLLRNYTDEARNEFICLENPEEHEVISKLAQTGVTIVNQLCPASPEQGFDTVFHTPEGLKIRPVFTHDKFTLFKPITPIKDKPKPVSPSTLGKTAKRLEFEQARPLKYVATLPPIETQYGTKRRRSSASIMGRSAASVFIDHGINTPKEQTHKIHWSHLIAKVLADDADVNLQNENGEQPLINLVPATGSSNLNVWLAVESFIIETLLDKKTDKIIMEVTPHYEPGISIPKLITYDLNWIEEIEGEKISKHEQFHCDPRSQHRINRKMQGSISTLREVNANHKETFAESFTNDSIDDLVSAHFPIDHIMGIPEVDFDNISIGDLMQEEQTFESMYDECYSTPLNAY